MFLEKNWPDRKGSSPIRKKRSTSGNKEMFGEKVGGPRIVLPSMWIAWQNWGPWEKKIPSKMGGREWGG